MDLHKKTFEIKLNGSPIILEISDLAGQTNASVIGKYGDTAVLVTVVMSKEDKGGDFFPLTVDYEERFYAAGKIMGSRFVRREGKSSDEAVLTGRLIDRTIRPLFDNRLRREVQVVVTVLSYDGIHDPGVIGLISTSVALGISDIPWGGPIGGMNYVKKEGEEIVINAFFAGPEEKINMIELEGKEINEEDAIGVFEKAEKDIKSLIDFQNQIIKEIGKEKKDVSLQTPDTNLIEKIKLFLEGKIAEAIHTKNIESLKSDLFDEIKKAEEEINLNQVELIFENILDAFVHEDALLREKRPDGRKLDEIRPLHGEIGLLKLTHGSGLFIRGTTQVLAFATLASTASEQLVESIEGTQKKRFMLHYNFPKFATGEVGKSSRGPGRREIGHGALAAKALSAIIPEKKEFPYAIRIVAETLSSNGSSSMASTCAGSLALMDAGVPIKKHVAGIAIGLMLDENGDKYKILTDIQGPEDHYGDMDFKIAGTKDGITAIQMDVKIHGITKTIFKEALIAGKNARLKILSVMENVISAPRNEVSEYAPKVVIINIPQEKIGEVIGTGGKVIQALIAESENQITIDIDEDGTTYVMGIKRELVDRAIKSIEQIIREFTVGEIVSGEVIKIFEFGAIIDLGGGKDGMIHISELKEGFVKKVEDVLKIGDFVKAKVIKVDNGNNKIALSLKGIE